MTVSGPAVVRALHKLSFLTRVFGAKIAFSSKKKNYALFDHKDEPFLDIIIDMRSHGTVTRQPECSRVLLVNTTT